MSNNKEPQNSAENSNIAEEAIVPDKSDEADADEAADTSENTGTTISDTEEVSPEETSDESDEIPEESAAKAVRSFDNKKIKKLSGLILCILVFLAAVGITIYYITTASKAEFHADCTDTIMWANASVESGHLYDPDFTYACFLPFNISLIMIPFIHIFGLSLTAHIMGMMSFFLLLTVFMLLMMKEIFDDIRPALIGTALFLSMTLSSQKMREIFWGHTIYYSLGILCLVIGAYMLSHLLNLREKKIEADQNGEKTKSFKVRLIVTFAILCLFVFLTGMNGITGFSLFTLPFVGAIFAEHLLDSNIKINGVKSAKYISLPLIFAVLAVLGNALNNKLLGDLTAGYQDGNSVFSNMDTWIDHLHSFPIAWLQLLGVTNMDGTIFTDIDGIINILCILNAGILAFMPVLASCFYNKFGNDRRGRLMRTWIWIHWAVTAVIIMGYVFGVLSGASWRIVPCIGTAVIVTLLFAGWSVKNINNSSRFTLLIMIPVIVAGASNLNTVGQMPKDGYKDNNLFALSDILMEEGLTRGYATFWNANSITLISENEVQLFHAAIDETGVHRNLYQSSSNWYKDDPEQSEYFLLVSDYEYNIIENSSNNIIPEAIRINSYSVNDAVYHVLVFDHNIIVG